MSATHVYIGRKSCGCCVAAVTDDGDKHTAAAVADFIKSGCTIERLSMEEYRTKPDAMPHGCKCPKPQQSTLFGGSK